MDMIQMQVIGTVSNDRIEPVDEGWGQVVSEIRLRSDLRGIVDGMDGFSHVLVVTYLHETPAVPDVRRRPRGREDMPMVGLLAQRARHRPNPIRITACVVVAAHEDRLVVRGLDAINGTPVLDLKPYYPIFDKRDAWVPMWADQLMKDYFEVDEV